MYKEAFTVIESFLEKGDFYSSCISVAFDICGHSGNREMAFQIRRAIERLGYPMVHNNWNALIECLARLGDVLEAMEVLCEEMPSPDVKTISMLLNFARKAGRREKVLHRIRFKYPRLLEEALSFHWDRRR
jgi:pentatricopeptide repeat protein